MIIERLKWHLWDKNYGIRQIRRHGLWFVDIPRTSSSSIKVELGQIFGKAYGKSNLLDKEYSQAQIFPDHVPAQQMREIIGKELWATLFAFAVVRNPWDRMVSLFTYRKKLGDLPKNISFKNYILQFTSPRYLLDGSLHSKRPYYYGMSEYILDSRDNVIVDFIARYENRDLDFKKISERIGIELGSLHIQKGSTFKRHYAEYYDEETKNIVGRIFSKDIELLAYSFEQQT